MTDHEPMLLQLYSDVERIKEQMKSIDEKMNTVVSVVGQQATIIRTFEDERQQKIGSSGTIKFLWGILAAGVTSIAYNLHDIIVFFFPPKLH